MFLAFEVDFQPFFRISCGFFLKITDSLCIVEVGRHWYSYFCCRKFKNSTDVDFFNPNSLVCRDYLPFSLSETVEEPVFLRFLCLEDPVLPRADMRSDSHKRTKNTTHTTLTRHGNGENKLKKNAHMHTRRETESFIFGGHGF